ncbi:MAG: hypothetical protein A2W23_04885 [Planctomycetes bacterium RBG_16_43_13]|nr:MAG: hypothetical protein A2W23_04885 [Planctomycetes bacterium RBG_16_43_13]
MEKKKIKKSLSAPIGTVISDCNFESHNQVIWDKVTLETIDKVAQGLLNLTQLFNSQKIVVDALLKICKEEE